MPFVPYAHAREGADRELARRIAIVSVNKRKASETFIHNHVRHLPADVHYLTGDYLPLRHCRGLDGDDTPFVAGGEALGSDSEREKIRRAEAVARYLREHRIEAVLAEYGLSGVEMSAICQELQIPLVVHFHGFDAYRDDILHGYGRRYPDLFRASHALVGVSRHMCQQLERLGADPEKVHWNPCGFDADMFEYHDAGRQPPLFLAAGRFTEKKAPYLTVLAFERVHRAFPEARLSMAGDGELHSTCQVLVKALGLDQAVRFLREIPHQDVALRMAEARAFVQHSITPPSGDREGTPVAVTEACASGLPVVATRHGGIPDVVVDGESGILVDEGDIAGMADAMLLFRFAREVGEATAMGRAGHARVQQEFSLRAHIDRLWRVIAASFEH